MDSGGYKSIYNDGKYQIFDEGDYFAVDKDYKHIASFKTKAMAFEFIYLFRRAHDPHIGLPTN